MKRDDDLIRGLLLEYEAAEDWLIPELDTIFLNAANKVRVGHVHLLCDAGFLVGVGKGTFRLTNQGHDYLASIRDAGIWQSTKKAVAETGGSAALEIVKAVAIGFAKKKISQHTGIDL